MGVQDRQNGRPAITATGKETITATGKETLTAANVQVCADKPTVSHVAVSVAGQMRIRYLGYGKPPTKGIDYDGLKLSLPHRRSQRWPEPGSRGLEVWGSLDAISAKQKS